MEPFKHLPEYRVLVCLSCRHSVPPPSLKSHIRTYRSQHPSSITLEHIRTVVQRLLDLDLLHPANESVIFPCLENPLLPDLPIYSGFACASCPFVARLESTLKGTTEQPTPLAGNVAVPSGANSARITQFTP